LYLPVSEGIRCNTAAVIYSSEFYGKAARSLEVFKAKVAAVLVTIVLYIGVLIATGDTSFCEEMRLFESHLEPERALVGKLTSLHGLAESELA